VLTYSICQIVIDENYEVCFSFNIDDANVKVRRHILLILMDCTMSLSHQMSNYTLVDVACFAMKHRFVLSHLLVRALKNIFWPPTIRHSSKAYVKIFF